MILDLSPFEILQHNWDGEDAIAPDMETIENFRWIVQKLKWPPFDIYANNNGCMDIESDTEYGTNFHLQVGIGSWSLYVRIGGSQTAVYYSQGKFADHGFPFEEAQIALDSLIDKSVR